MLLQKRGRVALAILNTVFLALASAAFAMIVYFVVSLATLPELPHDAAWNESLGVGLSRGFLILFFILDSVFLAAFSVVGAVFSALLIRKTDGRTRVYGIATAILHGVYAAVTAIFYITLLL